MIKPWLAAAAALLLAAPTARADVGAGDIELGLLVLLDQIHNKSDDLGYDERDDFGSIELRTGYFWTDAVEATFAASVDISNPVTRGTANLGVDCLFRASDTLLPVIGASYAFGLGELNTDYVEGHVGVKYFFQERASAGVDLGYWSALAEGYSSEIRSKAGINFYF